MSKCKYRSDIWLSLRKSNLTVIKMLRAVIRKTEVSQENEQRREEKHIRDEILENKNN